ncbi:response regulator receiver domain protein [Enterococcus faecalis 13-SD-W-01]|nr:response regulator receiver domain protein [Enterococcus faecalis 13-SD-W-01]
MEPPITLLLIDDEEAIRHGIKNLLDWEKEGFEIIGEAANGQEGLEKIIQMRPEIVITDLVMPKLNGIELAEIIQRQFAQTHFLVLSSYDDFSYVSKVFKSGAVDYLLKPTLTPENLLEVLRKIANQFTRKKDAHFEHHRLSNRFNRYLSGGQNQDTEIFEYFFDLPNFCFLYTNMKWYRESHLLLERLESCISNNDKMKTLSFKLEDGNLGLLINFSDTEKELKAMLKQSLKSMRSVDPQAFFVLSRIFSKICAAKEVYEEVRKQSEEQPFFFKTQFIVSIEELFVFGNTKGIKAPKLVHTVSRTDYIPLLEEIQCYFDELVLTIAAPSLLKQQASSVFYTFFSLLEETTSQENYNQRKRNFLHEITRAKHLEEFSVILLSEIKQMKQLLGEDSSFENEFVQKLQAYIFANYQKELTLSHLSEVFHFNYTYLSTLFTEKFMMNFTEYLKFVRLEKAEKLLRESDLSLEKISFSVGYMDVSYFSRIFKREYGLPPLRYRKRLKK